MHDGDLFFQNIDALRHLSHPRIGKTAQDLSEGIWNLIGARHLQAL
jgi:hypothetical protein